MKLLSAVVIELTGEAIKPIASYKDLPWIR